LMQARRSYN